MVGATRPPGVTSATVHFRNRSLPVAIIIHNYCFKTLCDNGSFSNLRDAYKLGFALRQEQNNEVDFDMIVDAFPRLYSKYTVSIHFHELGLMRLITQMAQTHWIGAPINICL